MGRIGYSSTPTSGDRVDVTPSTPLPISGTLSDASSVNTTITPLGSGATYTGTFEQNPYPDVMVSCITDNSGTLYFDFSVDGTNVNTFPTDGFAVTSGVHEFHIAVKGPREFRVRFVNDTGAQSYLRLYTYYGQFRSPNSPLNQTLSSDTDATVVRSVDSLLDISSGRFSGFTPVPKKWGHAPDGIQVTATDIWDRANATDTQYVWVAPTQARIHAIASTSASDAAAGVGIRTLRLFGLTSWDAKEVSEDVTMAGATPINTSNSYVIIHRMRALTAGTTGKAVGKITATAATDGTVTAQINIGNSSTEMAIYGIPSSQTMYFTRWASEIAKSSGAARDVSFTLTYNPEPDVNLTTFVNIDEASRQSDGTSSNGAPYNPYLPIVGPAIIKVFGVGSAAGIDGHANFSGILVDN